MAQFLILPSHAPDGGPAELAINLDQVTRVAVLGPVGSIEALQVYLADGYHFTLKDRAATSFFEVITQSNYAARLPARS